MVRILILYGTTHGHTRKIAEALAKRVREEECGAEARDARLAGADVRPEDYDGVIVAASIVAGGYQRRVRRWVRRHAAQLNARPTAFVSVCLAVLEQREEAQQAVRDITRRFLASAGWRPTVTGTIAGALPYTRYGWLTKRIMRRITVRAGSTATDITRDYEFTDWAAVAALAREFAQLVQRGAPARQRTAAPPFAPARSKVVPRAVRPRRDVESAVPQPPPPEASMRVADLMHTDLKAITPDATVGDAVVSLADGHVSALPVVDARGRLLGVLSTTDILTAIAEAEGAEGRSRLFGDTLVRDLMTATPLTVNPEETITEAARHMLYLEVHRLFVTDGGTLRGVISQSDIVGAVATARV
jgi:menaquinone-dependent protoporphyrinogen oxidase